MENTHEVSAPVSKGSVLNRISTYVLMIAMAILPFFFIPAASFSFSFSKMMLLVGAVLLAFLLWLVDSIRRGAIELPFGKLAGSAMLVPLAYLLASFFSTESSVSFIGQGFETGTFFAILVMFLLMLFVPIFFNSNEKIGKLYKGFYLSFIVVALFQLLRVLFGAEFLSFGGLFNNTVSNIVGKWNDLGIFFGLSALLSLSTLELKRTKGLSKWLLYGALIVSLFFMALVNFPVIWVVIGLAALFFTVYRVMFGEHRRGGEFDGGDWSISKFFSPISMVVFVISLIFVVAGGFLGDKISTTFNISQIEARPSWTSTFDIAKASLENDLLLGTGPNRFATEWLMNKPEGINNTIFWNTDFNSGIGTIPSAVTTVGLLGTIAWLVFIVLLLMAGLRSILMSGNEDQTSRYIGISSFLAVVYLWTFSFFYVPSVSVLALTFLFTGIFMAYEVSAGRMHILRINFLQDPKVGFASVFFIVVLLIGGVALGYVYTNKYVSYVNFQSGILAFNVDGDIDMAEQKLLSAVNRSQNDAYYRALAQLDIARLSQVVNQTGVPEEALRTQFQDVLGTAISHASTATEIDPRNYLNWQSLGQVYGSIIPLGIEGAYESSSSAYSRALELNPKSPSLYLTLARLEGANGDTVAARGYITEAIRLKGNYTEAVYFLAQIESAEGNTDAAISSVEAAATISPNDPTIFFQLGLLRYNANQFTNAIDAFERAVVLSPTYSNAKYFLGLSYYNVGRVEEAIGQFEDVSTLNPDNEEVKQIVTRLQSGEAPFESLTPPESTPEDRETLPIEE